ncbi:MAG: flagellar export chaperone FlgN [Pseudomonadota bacterium]|nr:flagellar export chaperone FlgN [Pseudomonadota bacterium]
MSIDTQHFASLLDQELTTARDIHGLMLQEKDALSANDLNTLQQLQQTKAARLQTLKDTAQTRLQWMQDQHLDSSAICLSHPDIRRAANIGHLWQELESQYHSNRTLSQQLSDIVLTARHRTLQKLKILRGRQNDPHLYDNKGNANNLSQGQGYIQA